MYTFNPLPVLDSLNDHGGFHFIAFMCVILFIGSVFTTVFDDYGEWFDVVIIAGLCGVALSISGYLSYNTGGIVTPANTKVEATFISYQPEGYNIAETQGKQTRHVDHHEMWVVYMLPDETKVILRANPGQAYPQRVTLYRN